jgi:DNA-binding response OmpR family regulator
MPSRVLVITTDEEIRRGFQPLLNCYNMAAVCAGTLSLAQEITTSSDVEAVILQAGFSGSLPGLHFVKWLRAQSEYRNTPVAVVIREDELQEHEVAAAKALAARVFRYPAALDEMLVHVNAAIIERRAA